MTRALVTGVAGHAVVARPDAGAGTAILDGLDRTVPPALAREGRPRSPSGPAADTTAAAAAQLEA